MKKRIRLSERDLHRVVNESVRRMLSESTLDNKQYEVNEAISNLLKAINELSYEYSNSGDDAMADFMNAFYKRFHTVAQDYQNSLDDMRNDLAYNQE